MSHKTLKTLLLLTAGATALSTAALAQTTPDVVVVVANRTPEPVVRVGESVTLIDAAAIQASQAPVISDLIATTPGVSFSRTGGPGGQTAVRIRGAEGEQTAVVVDGVKINDPSSPGGGYDFAALLTGDIDRVEILRGSQSTLWGSSAIGGVVLINTRSLSAPVEANASVEGGSFGTVYGRAGLGAATGPLTWRIAGGYYTTDGVSAFDKRFGGKEKDGFTQKALSGRATYVFTPDIVLDLRATWQDGKADIDGFPPPLYAFADTAETTITRQFVSYSGVNVSTFGGRLKNRVAFTWSDIDRVNDNPANAPVTTEFYAEGHTLKAEYQGTLAITDETQAVFGAEHERSTIRTASPASYAPNPTPLTAAADLDSLYAQVQGEAAPGLTLTGGGRFDHHSAFGDHGTGQLEAAYALPTGLAKGENTLLRASFGQGFKAPTLYQLYSPYGNPALKPETSNGWDAGIEQGLLGGAASVSATYFGRRTRNQIDFFGCYPTVTPFCATHPYGYYDNIARTRADGLEVAGLWKPMVSLTLDANYTYTRAKNESVGSANNGKDLARRPKDTANASASYLWDGGLTTTVAVRYAGASFDNASNSVRLKSYTLVDLRANYPLSHGLELYGRVENLFDEHYETAYRYGTLGRGGYVGVRAKF